MYFNYVTITLLKMIILLAIFALTKKRCFPLLMMMAILTLVRGVDEKGIGKYCISLTMYGHHF